MRKQLLAAVGAGTAALLLVAPMPASAAAKPKVKVVSSAVFTPFNLDVSTGQVLVADNIGNAVVKVKKDGTVKTIVEAVAPDGVAVSKDRRYLAHTIVEGNEQGITASGLVIIGPKGKVTADTLAYERANNPDAKLTYGVDNPDDCARRVFGPLANYRGLIDSHAYSVAAYGKKFVVADAGANNLLLVDRKGNISTIGVLPRQPLRISKAAAEAQRWDNCVVDKTYSYEAVPTDVEVGKDGWLYVTTLPGGPEDPSLGARGRVYKVNPKTGQNKLIARGFAGATNLALGKRGEIYVTELFAGRISVIKHGKVKPYVSLTGAVSVEADRKGNLWAGTVTPGPEPVGTIVKITKKK